MKKLSALIALVALVAFVGCNHCKDGIETIPYASVMDRYFSVYRPGCYFLYLNQDSTKSDSIYISNYYATVQSDKEVSCARWSHIQFDLHSSYISADKKLSVMSWSEPQTYRTYFSAKSSKLGFEIWATNKSDSLYSGKSPLTRLKFYKLWGNPQSTLLEVSALGYGGFQAIHFAPEIGIAEFVTDNNEDTFTITKVYTP